MKDPDVTSTEYRRMLTDLLTSGLAEARRGNRQTAASKLQRISSMDLLHESDYRQAGMLALITGQHQYAIQLLTTATELSPDNQASWSTLGDAYCNNGNLEQAIGAYEKALDLNPDAILGGLSQAYDLLGMQDMEDMELARIAERHTSTALKNGSPSPARQALIFALLPKSAGTSLSHAIGQSTGITKGCGIATTDRDHIPNSRLSHAAFTTAIRYPARFHTHIRATEHNLGILDNSGIERVFVHVRDPRQATVSYFHHSNQGMGLIRSRLINPGYDKLTYQEKFSWFFEFYYPRFINWIMEWVEVENNIDDHSFALKITTFENMLEIGQTRLVKEICDFFEMEQRSSPAEQKHRFRKGLADEWRTLIPARFHRAMSGMMPAMLYKRFGWKP